MSRLILPVLLLIAFIGTTIALNRVEEPELAPEATAAGTLSSPETPVFSVRRAPELLTSPRANELLTEQLEAWTTQLPSQSCFTVSSGSEVIYEHNPLVSLSPASNMKILTGLSALVVLGEDRRFTTTVSALSRPDENGVLQGDLYLIGGGDPLLVTDQYEAVFDEKQEVLDENGDPIITSARELAEKVVAANLSRIVGGIRVDESRYDSIYQVDRWPQRFLDQGSVGVLSAAAIDDGFLGWTSQYTQLAEPDPLPLPRSTDPTIEAARIFDDLLEASNVIIDGGPGRSDDTPTNQLVELASIESPPMTQIVQQMMVASDNTTAELLVKELGLEVNDVGSTNSGSLAISATLEEIGLPMTGFFSVDGSGLSVEDTVTCDLILQALNYPDTRDALHAAMPIAGETGTLSDDFLDSPARGAIRAKTGFLNTVTALSGYIETDQGVELTFSFIVNVDTPDQLSLEIIAEWQESLAEILLTYPEGPPLTDLGPIAVAGQADPSDPAEVAASERTDQADGGDDTSESSEDSTEDGADTAEGSDDTAEGPDDTAEGDG